MSQGSKLFVYGVNENCPREVLENEFGRCGEVTDVYNTGKGYAFVTMIDENAAQAAIRDLNGVSIDGGKPIKVSASVTRNCLTPSTYEIFKMGSDTSWISNCFAFVNNTL